MNSMASQMGGGMVGYLVELGRPAGTAAMAWTLEAGPGMDFATVAEQDAFREAWFASRGLPPTPEREPAARGGLLARLWASFSGPWP